MTALDDFDGLLNWPRLQDWIADAGVPGEGPVTEVARLPGGTQNNLFLLTRGAARFVLRRPPRHPRANSNDTMLREARVLAALADTDVPHPRFFAVCADTAVIGTCFYLMAPLDGFCPGAGLPERYTADATWRAAIGPEMIRAAAALAAIDPDAVGLADFGKREDWHARQVTRWRAQLESYTQLSNYGGHALPHVEEIGAWLAAHVPRDGRIGLIHGDFHIANVMFAHDAPRLTGLIDWELCTLGDPLLDLGWILSSWPESGDPEGSRPLVQPWDGFSSRAELVSLYAMLTGRDLACLPWFFALACYKFGCILEGTYARALAGQAPMETGQRLHEMAVWLMRKARQVMG